MITFEKNILQEDFKFQQKFVCDENGTPIIFYHGSSNKNIKNFELQQIGYRKSGWNNSIFEVKSGAIFFTLDKKVAAKYGKDRARLQAKGKTYGLKYKVYQVYLQLKNPLDLRKITNENLNILLNIGFNSWEKFGVLDNSGYMSTEDIFEWRKEHGYSFKNPDKWNDMEGDEDFEQDYYYNIDNLNASPSQFWAVADNINVVNNLKKEGYDGLIVLDDDNTISVAVFDSNQIKMI